MHVNKKLITLPILVIIALSIAGFAYAHWSDLIRINGTVKMGSLKVVFKEIETPAEYKRRPDGTLDPTEGGKPWVCNTTSWLDEYYVDVHTNKTGWEKLWIKIKNAYPCYEVHQTFVIHNVGTVPADIVLFNVTDPTGQLTWVQNTTYLGFKGDLVDANGKAIINIEIVNAKLPWQLDPCWPEKMEIDIHIKQDALECHTYKFEVEIVYQQWN